MNSITVNDVQKIIGYPIWAKLPSDYKVAVNALNRGVPFVVGAPGSKISESISGLVDTLTSGQTNVNIVGKGKKPSKKVSLFKKK